jgi:hypothetical protein
LASSSAFADFSIYSTSSSAFAGTNWGASMEKPTVKQSTFYAFIFLFGFIYQPNWVYENFWSKAEFYQSLPFQFPYFGYILIYSFLSTGLVFYLVKFVKRHLWK